MDKPIKLAVGEAIKAFRSARKISQENLGVSQSYISTLENGGTWNATIGKVDQIGEAMDVHPLSIVAAAYRLAHSDVSREELLRRIERELIEINL